MISAVRPKKIPSCGFSPAVIVRQTLQSSILSEGSVLKTSKKDKSLTLHKSLGFFNNSLKKY